MPPSLFLMFAWWLKELKKIKLSYTHPQPLSLKTEASELLRDKGNPVILPEGNGQIPGVKQGNFGSDEARMGRVQGREVVRPVSGKRSKWLHWAGLLTSKLLSP